MKKATKRQVKRHNQQLVLRAIYEALADNRAALAQETGLTKPTISTIVSDLIDRGLVQEGGRGDSTSSGGKRPRLLNFVPHAQQLIAISVDSNEILGCLAYLDGFVVARHHIALQANDDVFQMLNFAINALIAQKDAPLLCVSIGVPGLVDEVEGIVKSSPSLGWRDKALASLLNDMYDVPILVGNNTEFATRARLVSMEEPDSLVTLFVSDTIEIGSTLNGENYQYGGDIAVLQVPNGNISQLEWHHVRQRIKLLVAQQPESMLNVDNLTYLHIKQALYFEDVVAQQLLTELAETLGHIYAWILALMRPSQISLAGRMSLIGEALIDAIQGQLTEIFPERAINGLQLTLAQDDDLTLQGAIANALHKELGVV